MFILLYNPQKCVFGYSLNLDPSHFKFIAQVYIHKCKFSKKTISFFVFKKDFDVYINSLRNSSNCIACKIHGVYSYKLT